MSAEEREQIEQLITLLQKAKKRDVAKIFTALFTGMSLIFFAGQKFDNWAVWRGSVDKRLDRVESATIYKTNRQITLR